uniref:Uncharacterized protein n=1 Tax=Magallana gigas TaxID=29159 RepID=K1S207_MAGGI
MTFVPVIDGTGNVQTPKKKISWNDIINPNYNPNRISPWESNKTKPTQRQRFPTPIHPSSNGGAAPLRQRSNGVQNNQQPTNVVKPKPIVYEWKVIESNFQPTQKLTTTVPPTTNLPATTTPMPDNSYYYDMTTMSPGQFLHNFFFGHDYFYYYPDYYTATVSPTPAFRYSGKKRSTFVSSTEEPEYESEDMTTSLPTKTSSGGSGIEAEDITTTAKPNVPGVKFTTTTERPVTEEIEAEDRTTTPSSKGQKTQQATTTQATEQEAESATTKAPKTTTTAHKAGAYLRFPWCYADGSHWLPLGGTPEACSAERALGIARINRNPYTKVLSLLRESHAGFSCSSRSCSSIALTNIDVTCPPNWTQHPSYKNACYRLGTTAGNFTSATAGCEAFLNGSTVANVYNLEIHNFLADGLLSLGHEYYTGLKQVKGESVFTELNNELLGTWNKWGSVTGGTCTVYSNEGGEWVWHTNTCDLPCLYICEYIVPTPGQLPLVLVPVDSVPLSGRLEIFAYNMWGGFRDSGPKETVGVVCQDLDIGESCAGATCGTGKIWYDKVKCNVDSANMSECLDGAKLYTSDDHSKDTIIRCKGIGAFGVDKVMSRIRLLIMVILSSSTTNSVMINIDVTCPPNWTQHSSYKNICYRVGTTAGNFTSATAGCEAFLNGSTVANVYNLEIHNFLADGLLSVGHEYYTGLTDVNGEYVFTQLDSEPLGPWDRWGSVTGGTCTVYANEGGVWVWHTNTCDQLCHYICEYIVPTPGKDEFSVLHSPSNGSMLVGMVALNKLAFRIPFDNVR